MVRGPAMAWACRLSENPAEATPLRYALGATHIPPRRFAGPGSPACWHSDRLRGQKLAGLGRKSQFGADRSVVYFIQMSGHPKMLADALAHPPKNAGRRIDRWAKGFGRWRQTVHFELTRLFPPFRRLLMELGRRWTDPALSAKQMTSLTWPGRDGGPVRRSTLHDR